MRITIENAAELEHAARAYGKTTVEKKVSKDGRLYLGQEHAGKNVKVVVLESNKIPEGEQ